MKYIVIFLSAIFIIGCTTNTKTINITETNYPKEDPFDFEPIQSCTSSVTVPKLVESNSGFVSYPEELRREGVQGKVILQFEVNKSGEVQSVSTVSSPDDRLTEISKRIMNGYKFEPGTCDSTTVEFKGTSESSYNLNR